MKSQGRNIEFYPATDTNPFTGSSDYKTFSPKASDIGGINSNTRSTKPMQFEGRNPAKDLAYEDAAEEILSSRRNRVKDPD